MPEPFDLAMADGRQPVVAVIIDNRASAMVATALVRQFGCRVLAGPGCEAMLGLLARIARVDLVVLDLGLTSMDGFAAAGLIHALAAHRTVPIVALAGRETDLALRCRAAGVTSTVAKPFSPRELHAALKAALCERRATMLS